MDRHDVRYEVDGAVALITLDRPRYRNAQSWRLLDELDAALDRAVGDKSVKVAIVRGAGEHFSAGHDLGTPEQVEERQRRGIPDTGLLDYETFRKYNLDYTLKWRNLPKPTVAMVRGYCIYGGWMIAAAMDVVFAAPDARFLAGQVEYFSIPWDVGARKAKELLFESRFITAVEAQTLGFVNRVIDAADLERETLAWAKRVSDSPHGVLRMAKLAINKIQDVQGFSASMEGAFADFLVLAQMGGHPRKPAKERRLGGVDLALRGARGERER
jgi:enoyl-CoA hydratase